MDLFGFTFKKKKSDKEDNENLNSFAPVIDGDGTTVIQTVGGSGAGGTAGYFGQYLDIDGSNISDEKGLIIKYRSAATNPSCDAAISDIVDASITSDDNSVPINLRMDDLDIAQTIKDKINEEFRNVIRLLKFNEFGAEYFRRWYIDGRIYFHILVDLNDLKSGIQGMQELEPSRMKKMREVTTETDKVTKIKKVITSSEYYQYTDNTQGLGTNTVVKINPESIIYVPSGLLSEDKKVVISHLHKALKLVNQLRMMEDSLVIYRLSRAPERRIFYIDVGNLPKAKAEEYVQSIMAKYRNKLVYNASSGEIVDEAKSMSLVEDFWLPRKEGGRGTEITTLPGGDNLGQIDDITYFKDNLYKALNVPISRLISDSGFNIGRATEISRDEVKFHKFIARLRKKFSYVIINALRIQLLLKNIITDDDWSNIKEKISLDYSEDNYFSELKEFEILKERLSIVSDLQQYKDIYFSEKWIKSNVLRQSDEDIKRLAEERDEEKKAAKVDTSNDAADTSDADTSDVDASDTSFNDAAADTDADTEDEDEDV